MEISAETLPNFVQTDVFRLKTNLSKKFGHTLVCERMIAILQEKSFVCIFGLVSEMLRKLCEKRANFNACL